MAVSREFLAFVLDQLGPLGPVVPQHMFGGVGLYHQGLFFGIVADDTLYFKVDDLTRPRYQAAGSAAFDPYHDGRASFRYFTVPIQVLEDRDALSAWARDAVAAGRVH